MTVDIEHLSQQKAFDIALEHIRQQGCPSGLIVGNTAICKYRGPEGRGCAFAPFITDYNPQMENKKAYAIMQDWANSVRDVAHEAGFTFMDLIQECHDSAFRHAKNMTFAETLDLDIFMEEYEQNMEVLSKKYELNYSKPQPA